MMFYTTIGGWMLSYFVKMVSGTFVGLLTEQVKGVFDSMTAQPVPMVFWMVVVVLLGMGVCSLGLQNGVEKITKIMMCSLFFIMIALAIRAVMLPGAMEGLKFYLMPDFGNMAAPGRRCRYHFCRNGPSVFYLEHRYGLACNFWQLYRQRTLPTGEAVNITLLDTSVALIAGLIIFPACFSFGIQPDSGPNLVFVTLPNIFNSMAGGQLWGSLFFIFMSFASLSTIIAVFENIVSFGIDLWGWSRKKAVVVNIIVIILLSLPCVFGFNLLSGIQPLGSGSTILDLEDFYREQQPAPARFVGLPAVLHQAVRLGMEELSTPRPTPERGFAFPNGSGFMSPLFCR